MIRKSLIIAFMTSIYQIISYNNINKLIYDNKSDFNYNFHVLTVYGNELQQANLYFSDIDNNKEAKQLEKESFNEYFQCTGKFFESAMKCIEAYNKIHEFILPDEKQYMEKYTNNSIIRAKDCSYNISLQHVKSFQSPYIHFYYNVIESNCKSNYTYPGGSSFESFAVTSHYLTSCKQIKVDRSNNYTILCTIPKESLDIRVSNNNINVCMNLTVLLFGMHFDNFNEVMRNLPDRYYFRSLSDNHEHCYNYSAITNHDKLSTSNNFNISNNLWYYTGIWENSSKSIDIYNYGSKRHMPASRLQYNMLHFDSSDVFGPFPYLFYHFQYNDLYNFQPKIITTTNSSMMQLKLSSINTTVAIELLTNHTNEIYFLGASHMRYNFDGLVMFLYGEEILSNLDRKHGYVSIQNIVDLCVPYSSPSLFADDQTDFLNKKCNDFELEKSDNKSKILIFQTGAWDLQKMPLSRTIRSDVAGIKLINKLSEILSGNIRCGNLNHFIWVTSVPYPICMHDDDNACSEYSGHRTNAAISALNQFYLKHLMKINVTDRIRFSIVDSYSIIKPRVILNRYYELVCYSHYLCRIPYRGNIPTLIHTPGGDALMNSLILALVSNLV